MTDEIVPSGEQAQALAGLPADRPVVMLNLLRYRQPDGEEHYRQYAAGVIPHLQRVGARPLYGADALATLVGEGAKPWWDAVLLVEYPSPEAFREMVTDPEYLKVHEHREAALERAELHATSVWGPPA